MNISIQTCFDTGRTFGLNDTPFDRLKNLSEAMRQRLAPITYPSTGPIGYNNPLGNGFRLMIPVAIGVDPAGPPGWQGVVGRWKAAAESFSRTTATSGKYPGTYTRATPELVTLVHRQVPTRCFYDVYAIGTAFVRLDFDEFPDDQVHQLFAFYECYEWAAYREELAGELTNVVADVLDALQLNDDSFVRATARATPETIFDAEGHRISLAIPYFNLVVSCRGGENISEILGVIRGANNNVLETFEFFNQGKLHFGWKAQVVQTSLSQANLDEVRDRERILYILQLASVFLTTCEVFESKFIAEIGNVVLSGDVGVQHREKTSRMRRLRLLAQSIAEVTDFDVATPSEEDRDFFRRFESAAGMSKRRERIRRMSDLLNDVVKDDADERRERHDRSLASFLAVLAILALMSVVADIVGEIEFDNLLNPLWINRIKIMAWSVILIGAVLSLTIWIMQRLRDSSKD